MSNNLSPKWINHFYNRAMENAKLSKLPIKVGACLVDLKEKRSISDGHNGFPKGFIDTTSRCKDEKYIYQFGIHAEKNAVLFCPKFDLADCIMFITRFPCPMCMAELRQRNLTHYYSPKPDLSIPRYVERYERSKPLMFECGIVWTEI